MKHLEQTKEAPQRRSCRVLDQPRSTQRYERRTSDTNRKIVARMHELVRQHPRWGSRRIWWLLRAEGWRINRKRVYRLWRLEGFKVPQKQRKRRRLGSSANSIVRHRSGGKDHVWCWDFIHDRDERGRPLKWLSILDEFTRECLALEVDRSITSGDVIEVLRDLFMIRGGPRHIRGDNGPEFIARSIREWLALAEVQPAGEAN